MSLQVFVAHTGERLPAGQHAFTTLDALRTWVHQATSIPPRDQVFLTGAGKQVRPQVLLTEKEIFLFDRELLAPSSPNAAKPSVALTPIPADFHPTKPSDTLTNPNDLQAWQTLFKARRAWARDLVDNCRSMSDMARKHFEEHEVIERGLSAAVSSLESHVRSAEQKHAEARAWSEDVLKEQKSNIQGWEADFSRLDALPANSEFIQFVQPRASTPRKDTKKAVGVTLKAFVSAEDVKNAATMAQKISTKFGKHVGSLDALVENITSDSNDLFASLERMQNQSVVEGSEESLRLMEELEIVAKKIASDYEHVLSLPAIPKSVTQVSKMALLHTRNYLPAMQEYGIEMNDALRHAIERRNVSATRALDHMHTISKIETDLAVAHTQLSSLDVPADAAEAFSALGLVSTLPYVYGSLLVESVRRREWIEKMRKDSSALAESIATYQEEEERRRRRWIKKVGDVVKVDALTERALGIEVNLQVQQESWPYVTRQDLDDYLKTLRGMEDTEAVVTDLTQAVTDLDRPTKKQVKRAKNFRNGSIHEAAFGTTSLKVRGDDEYKVLQDAYAKLEDELRGQKSRVRKLEDLVHRESNAGRVSAGNMFQMQRTQGRELTAPDPNAAIASPRLVDNLSRHSSVSSRRHSVNQGDEEKKLARRVVKLEAELAVEKDRGAGLEKEVAAKKNAENDANRQIEEANSTKNDLMENMEAQQKEFASERRTLEQDLQQCRTRIEELEDELERIQGSRDNEQAGTDSRIRTLEVELNRVRQSAAEEGRKAQDELESVRQELSIQKEQVEQMHLQRTVASKEHTVLLRTNKELEAKLQRHSEAEAEQRTSLLVAHSHLSSGEAAPENHGVLAQTLEELARRSTNHVQDLSRAIAMARSENDSLRSTQEARINEVASAEARLVEHESEMSSLRSKLAAQEAKATSLSAELDDEREQLKSLRSKFAEGETGSEALRQRVAEEEDEVGRLSAELAEAKSHANSLDAELMKVQSRRKSIQADADAAAVRLYQRSSRAKQLSQRLYEHSSRLMRMLESLGFAVAHRDDSMVVERASKMGASTVFDPSTNMTRTLSSPPPPTKASQELPDLSLLYWMESEDAEEEASMFTEFMSTINRFNLDIFSEAISKRMRDLDYTARKWQREARGYREKALRYQSEGHDKIAFKSFKDGDLALFLPTRNQATRPWAAFNVNAPHYFLREQDSHKLRNREWLVARISKVEERVVDLSKTMGSNPQGSDGRSIGEVSEGGASFDDDNPFELSDGLRWYLLDAAEEKAGAPTTPGLGKSTVASAHVDARGSIRVKKSSGGNDASKTLNKSLDSRRSSSNSKKGVTAAPTLMDTVVDAEAPSPADASPIRL
ncbi:hypothetical protein LTR04_004461, partial [Oleoguttula sp. CCFEE 6159]